MNLKLRRTGNSLSTTWPKELLARMGVQEGDQLYVVETLGGVLVTPTDTKFETTMNNAERVISRFKHAYLELSKK